MKEDKQILKHPLLLNKEEYNNLNDKISTSFKDYLLLMYKFSYEINYIDQIINSCIPKNKFNIKSFINNQHLLIKELINIINALSELQIYSNRSNSNTKRSMMQIIRRNNSNAHYLKQKSKTNDKKNNFDLNLFLKNKIKKNTINTIKSNKKDKKMKLNISQINNINNEELSFLNIKIPHKKKYKRPNQSIKIPEEIDYNNNRNDYSKSSITTNIFSTKNKSYINNSSSFISSNDINNHNNNYIRKNSNRSITSYNNKSTLKNKRNIFKYSEKNIVFNSKLFLNNLNDRNIKKRSYSLNTNTNISKDKNNNKIKIKSLNLSGIIKTNDSKNYDNSSNKRYFPSSVFSDSVSEDIHLNQKKYKKVCNIVKDKKLNNIKYEVVKYFQISPNRLTKQMLDVSYSKINEYERKRKQNFLGKRSKSLLI